MDLSNATAVLAEASLTPVLICVEHHAIQHHITIPIQSNVLNAILDIGLIQQLRLANPAHKDAINALLIHKDNLSVVLV